MAPPSPVVPWSPPGELTVTTDGTGKVEGKLKFPAAPGLYQVPMTRTHGLGISVIERAYRCHRFCSMGLGIRADDHRLDHTTYYCPGAAARRCRVDGPSNAQRWP